MLKWFVIVCLVLGGWQHYHKTTQTQVATADTTLFDRLNHWLRARKTPSFSCDNRQYCSQMSSLDEARYFIQHCPDTRMDNDNDGVPCENDSRFFPRGNEHR